MVEEINYREHQDLLRSHQREISSLHEKINSIPDFLICKAPGFAIESGEDHIVASFSVVAKDHGVELLIEPPNVDVRTNLRRLELIVAVRKHFDQWLAGGQLTPFPYDDVSKKFGEYYFKVRDEDELPPMSDDLKKMMSRAHQCE